MRKIRYISLSIFILGVILFVCPSYNIYALDTSYSNEIVNSVSGEGTEQDYKDLYAETMLAQAIIDGGQVDFSRVDTPIAWIDFVDSITTPILQTIDDASPVDINLAGLNSRINECLLDYYENGIVRNMNSSLTIPNSVGNVFSQMMRSKAQKSYIGGGGTSVGETLLQIAKDFYLMNLPEEEQEHLPNDYLWFQNINNLFINDYDFFDPNSWLDTSAGARISNYTIMGGITSYDSITGITNNHHIHGSGAFNGACLTPKLTLYLNYDSASNKYLLTYTSYSLYTPDGTPLPNNNHCYFRTGAWGQPKIDYALYGSSPNEFNIRTSFNSFDVAINYIYSNFSNINFYVDNNAWVLSETNNKFSFGGVTVNSGNNPMELDIPEFYSFDYGRFKDIILDAINHSSIVMYEDIADCFLDINGQTCIATYSVVRNDYDDLVYEQFNMVSYPRFNSDLYTKTLVDQFRDDTQAGVQIIKNSYSIYPQTLTDALLYCGLLVLFGLLIRRFLE